MKKIIYTSLLCLLFVGCNSQSSLQKYMVENSENPNFIAIDLGANIVDIKNKYEFSKEEKKTLESLKKFNILFFRKKEDNQDLYLQEKEKIQRIINENSQYEQLARFGNKGSKVSIYLVGTEKLIDEIVLFASEGNSGFAIVRLLGKKMNIEDANNFISILQKANIGNELAPLFDSL